MNEHNASGTVFRFGETLLLPDCECNTLTVNFSIYDIYSLSTLLSFFISGKGLRKVYFPFKYHESYEYIFPKLPK